MRLPSSSTIPVRSVHHPDVALCTVCADPRCAFPPEMFGRMFELYLASTESYNEIVIGTDHFAIEAVISDDRHDGRALHQRILSRFGLNERQLPLLRFGFGLKEYNSEPRAQCTDPSVRSKHGAFSAQCTAERLLHCPLTPLTAEGRCVHTGSTSVRGRASTGTTARCSSMLEYRTVLVRLSYLLTYLHAHVHVLVVRRCLRERNIKVQRTVLNRVLKLAAVPLSLKCAERALSCVRGECADVLMVICSSDAARPRARRRGGS